MAYEDFYKLAGNAKQHSEFEKYLRDILFKPQERADFYRGLLKIDNDVSKDTFKAYFEEYAAERKSNKQDYTPDSVAKILSLLTRSVNDGDFSGHDPTAGTGSLIIQKWYDDMMQENIFSYAPHRYFYLCEELADNAIPYLLHNLALRGMNAMVVHGDTLERKVKQIYFVQNSEDDCLLFSDINVMPHTDAVAEYFDVREWLEEPIEHIESSVVKLNWALPMQKKELEVNTEPPKYRAITPWENSPRLKDVAIIERAKKGKIYPKGASIIQMSATKGQVGMLESDGEVPGHYAVVCWHYNLDDRYQFEWLKYVFPKWLHRVQEGLNVTLEAIMEMPFMVNDFSREYEEIIYGQLSLF